MTSSMNQSTKKQLTETTTPAPEGEPEGARRATGVSPSGADVAPPVDPEVEALLVLPKPRVTGLVVSVASQARLLIAYTAGAYLAALLLARVLVLAFADDPAERFFQALAATTTIAAVPLLIALFMLVWSAMNHRHFRELNQGQYLVHWLYTPEEWKRYVERCDKKFRQSLWVLPAAFGCVGLMVAIISYLDNNPMVFDSVILRGLFFLAIGLTVGLIVNLFAVGLGKVTYRLRQKAVAQCVIGLEGLYITGEYWPWAASGQTLDAVNFDESHPNELVFVFFSSSGRGSTEKEIPVPVPDGQAHVAAAVARLLG